MYDIHTHTHAHVYTHKYIYIHTFIYLYNHLFIRLSWSCLKNFIRFLFETHFSASFLICSFTCALTCCLYLPLFLPLLHFVSSFLHSLIFADSPWLDLTWVSASGMARFNFIVLQTEGREERTRLIEGQSKINMSSHCCVAILVASCYVWLAWSCHSLRTWAGGTEGKARASCGKTGKRILKKAPLATRRHRKLFSFLVCQVAQRQRQRRRRRRRWRRRWAWAGSEGKARGGGATRT